MAVAAAIAGPVIQGVTNKTEADLKAKEEERRIDILRGQAQRELQVARADARAFRRKHSRGLARSRAVKAASGVLSAGSPLLVDLDRTAELELGVLGILNAGALRASELRQEIAFAKANIEALETAGILVGGRSAASAVSAGRAASISAPRTTTTTKDTSAKDPRSGSSGKTPDPDSEIISV